MLHHMLRAAAQRAFSTLDPYFKYVTMLLHGDGSALGSDTVTPFNSDASTNAFNVTINGDARSNNFNPYQAGYYSNSFSSTGSYLSVPYSSDFNLTGDFTIEFWMNPSNLPTSTGSAPQSYCRIFSFGTYNAANSLGLEIGSNDTSYIRRVISWYNGTQYSLSSNNAVTTNSWQHIALVRSGTTITCYVNGTSTGTITGASAAVNTSQSFYIASLQGYESDPSAQYAGYLSNFSILKGTAKYTGNFTPTTSPLSTSATNQTLLTCYSNRFLDANTTTTAKTITANGSPQVAPAQPFTLPTSVATYGSGYFDGSGDYLTVSSSAGVSGTGAFTVEFWAYMTTTQTFSRPVSGGADQFTIDLSSDGVINYGKAGVNNIISSNVGKVLGAWCHIVVARSSGGTARIWANGTSIGTATDSNNYTAGTVYIASTNVPNFYLTGYISNLRITNTDVYGTSNTTITVPTTLLTAVSGTSLLTTQYNGAGNNNGFKDSSQNNFVITRNGNTTQGTFSPYGSNWSNYFVRSSSQYLTVSNAGGQFSFGTGAFTIECWVNLASLPSSTGYPASYWMFGGGPVNSNPGIDFYLNNTQIGFNLTDFTSPTAIGNHGMSVGTWYHVAVVRGGGSNQTVSIYVNGTRVATASSVTATADAATTGISISAAEPSGATSGNFDGYISNHRVVKGTAVYDPTSSTLTVPTAPLTAISGTSLLTCQSNRFIDNSTNALTISTSGSPSVQRFSPFSPTTAYSTSVIGGSGYFDGSDYLSAPGSNSFNVGSGEFCVEAWVYPTSTSTDPIIFTVSADARASNNDYGIFVGMTTTQTVYCGIYYGVVSTDFSTSSTVTLNAWNHIAMVRRSGVLYAYINGVQGGSIASTVTANFSSSWTPKIGYFQSTSTRYLTGYISNLRFVVGAPVYTGAFTPPTAPLTAITNTSLLLNTTNAGVLDNAMMNDLETVPSAQLSTSVKKFGTASMKFDGDTDYVGFPVNQNVYLGTANFTIEFWAYWNAFGSDKKYVINVTNASNYWQFLHDSTTGIAFVVNSGQIFSQGSNSGWSTGTWYHIALVRNGSTLTAYRNGTSVASGSLGTSALNNYTTFCIGGSAGFPSTTMDGYIDEFRLTKGVARYTSNFTAPTTAFPNN